MLADWRSSSLPKADPPALSSVATNPRPVQGPLLLLQRAPARSGSRWRGQPADYCEPQVGVPSCPRPTSLGRAQRLEEETSRLGKRPTPPNNWEACLASRKIPEGPAAGSVKGLNEEEFVELLRRARGGETAFVLAAVDQDQALLNRAGRGGLTLLNCACERGHLELVQGLVERGSDLHAKDNNGWDALFLAAIENPLAVATYLLDRGADPCTSSDSWTALGLAAWLGRQEMCLLLLSRGADLDAVMRGFRAEGAEERTALELYGADANPRLCPLKREQRRQALREAFAEGPHITQVRRRNMERRLPLLIFAAEHDFQPLAARRAELLELHPALPTNVPIPGDPIDTPAQRLALLRMRVLGDKDLFRHIVSFD